jgi:hypothetical protein
VRRKLAADDDGDRQMVDILTAVLSDGLPAVCGSFKIQCAAANDRIKYRGKIRLKYCGNLQHQI